MDKALCNGSQDSGSGGPENRIGAGRQGKDCLEPQSPLCTSPSNIAISNMAQEGGEGMGGLLYTDCGVGKQPCCTLSGLFLPCWTSQKMQSVSHGHIGLDIFAYCHAEIKVAEFC